MTTTTYAVKGMSCGHCVNAVTGELSDLGGVSAVTVDLVPGGNSSVTIASEAPLSPDAVNAALDAAGGYQIGRLPAPPASPNPGRRACEHNGRAWRPGFPLSAGRQSGQRLIEAGGPHLFDKDLQLVHAHLHSLAEIIGDDDPPLRRGFRVDKQFRAAATAVSAQQDESGKTPVTVIHFCAPFARLPPG
jgi:copper chaperone CopZ